MFIGYQNLSLALGVAHQALEEINPAGDNILIQGFLFVYLTIYNNDITIVLTNISK